MLPFLCRATAKEVAAGWRKKAQGPCNGALSAEESGSGGWSQDSAAYRDDSVGVLQLQPELVGVDGQGIVIRAVGGVLGEGD